MRMRMVTLILMTLIILRSGGLLHLHLLNLLLEKKEKGVVMQTLLHQGPEELLHPGHPALEGQGMCLILLYHLDQVLIEEVDRAGSEGEKTGLIPG